MLYQCGSNPKSWWQKWKGGDLKTHKHTSTTETKRCKESITGSSQLITYIPVSLFKRIKFWYITLCIGRVLRWPPKFVVSREHILYNPSSWVWQDMYLWGKIILKIQFSSVTQSCPTLCDPMNLSTTGLPVHHQLPEFTQTHIHRVGDAIQPSHPLSSPSPPSVNLPTYKMCHYAKATEGPACDGEKARLNELMMSPTSEMLRWTLV